MILSSDYFMFLFSLQILTFTARFRNIGDVDIMRASLIEVCRDLRMHNRFSRTQVAARINRGEQVIQRFESGAGGWSPKTGEIVAAHADLADITVVEIWTASVNRMREALRVSPPSNPHNADQAKALATQAEAATSRVRDSRSQAPRRAKGRQ